MDDGKYSMQISRSPDAVQRELALRRVTTIRDVLRNTESPAYQSTIRAFGFDLNFFNGLLNGTYNDWVSVREECHPLPPKVPIEHLIIRDALTPDGKKMEDTLVTMFKSSEMLVRPAKPLAEFIGFEAVLLHEGSITYDILYGVNHATWTYAPEEATRFSITLQPGDLLIVPRAVPRQVSEVKNGSKYLYVGDRWSDDDLPIKVTRSV